MWTGIAQSVQRLATRRTVRGSSPGGTRCSAAVQTGPGAHPASYTMGTGYFPWVKRTGRVDHPLPSSAEVKEREELYLYSPSGSSWPVLGCTLPFTFHLLHWLVAVQVFVWDARMCRCI